MHRVLLLGAGKIGSAIAKFLSKSGDYDVLVVDADEQALDRLCAEARVDAKKLDVTNQSQLLEAMNGRTAAISALTYALNAKVAEAALQSGCSYFDLTEDVRTTKAIRTIAAKAKPNQIFMPQCGLAPGFVAISANSLAQQFDEIDEVRLRVGALPLYPTNRLKYNLTWSTDGLINEYGNPCEAIVDKRMINVLPLEGHEHFSIDGVEYEAFNTSGGVGTLCETLEGKCRTLNYKTIRYPGHRELMVFLMNELKLNDDRETIKMIFDRTIPATPDDVVLIFCTVKGMRNGRLTELTDSRKVYHGDFMGEKATAIQLTTALSLCAIVDLHLSGRLPSKGFVRQEDVALEDFLANRFGKVYDVTAK